MTTALDVILTSCQKRHPRTPSSCCICTQRASVRVSNSHALPKTNIKSNPISPHLNARHDHGTTTTTTHWRINGKKKKVYENRLNNSSDQLYMQRTNNLTNKHKRCWKRKVGARVQKKILGLPGDDDTEMFLRFYSRAGVAAATPGAAFACSVIAGRHVDWWVSRMNKETRHWSRERERKEREEIREEEERQRARERENRRARFLAMAFWRRSDDGLYTAQGPSPPPPKPTLMLGFWKITT